MKPIIVILPRNQNVQVGSGQLLRTVKLRPGQFVLITETNPRKTFLVKCTKRCAENFKGHYFVNPNNQSIKVVC
jgi:ferric-dicitrate binding protein FerR (iron transport regulator)